MPGLGQIYNGELTKGVSYVIILGSLYVLGARWALWLPDRMLLFGVLATVLAAFALYAFTVFEAFSKASRTDAAHQLKTYNRWYFYLAVWLVGNLALGSVYQYVKDHFIEAYRIPTKSMEPAIQPGDCVLADRTAYRRATPQRGDIVIFVYPDDRSKKFIKRLEALPGDTIRCADSTKKVVPHGSVYVLGDNREDSLDSRHFGFVPLGDVLARVRQVYYSSGKDGIRWGRIGMPFGRPAP
jgi:signal peptidase I